MVSTIRQTCQFASSKENVSKHNDSLLYHCQNFWRCLCCAHSYDELWCYLFTLHFCQLCSLSPHEVAALLRGFRHCSLAYTTTFLCVFSGIILHSFAILQKFPIYYCFPSLPCLFLLIMLLPFYFPLHLPTVSGWCLFSSVPLAWIMCACICQILIVTETFKINFLQGIIILYILLWL